MPPPAEDGAALDGSAAGCPDSFVGSMGTPQSHFKARPRRPAAARKRSRGMRTSDIEGHTLKPFPGPSL